MVRESITVAGRAEWARAARALLEAVFGPGHPCADDAALLVSELRQGVRRSGSGALGKTFTAAVRAGSGVVRVEVTDRRGLGMPELLLSDGDAEVGWGLELGVSWPPGGASVGAWRPIRRFDQGTYRVATVRQSFVYQAMA